MAQRDRMTRVYDRTMRGSHQRRYYGNSGFYNFGYWADGPEDQAAASAALVEKLLEPFPETGRILDVACGLGASTALLAERYGPGAVTGINISEKQVADARKRVPDADFAVMSATKLDFPDNHFDAILCVEAAFHFDTRDAFLREALRVLKPGGVLALSDILVRDVPDWFALFGKNPPDNLLPDQQTYLERLNGAGFTEAEVVDETGACLAGFCRNLSNWPAQQYRAGRMKFGERLVAGPLCGAIASYFNFVCRNYMLVTARKPI